MLLDSNKLTKDLEEHCKRLTCDIKSELVKEVYETAYQHVIEFIEIQPVAYDMDKVIERLENQCTVNSNREYRKGFTECATRFIQIIREGGVNE